ncbi:VOC family protein [Cognatishimia sp. F0-27]|uniref:VOC family protein n=1 Tax=Cognatishimia sp. F0-27 TaxID=2816855 RepID=UPI001D0C05D9|nr:VOC family protein [Cognatishimia sp. F0-27]MCC1494870.1 VOC family protein [Cognatishimia sp. F0-27]
MELGAFSLSLGVKDLDRSRAFYERLGFVVMGGDPAQNYLIMKNGQTVIGLFQGMFDGPMLTFNPGWDQNADPLESFTDVREIKAALARAGQEIAQETGEEHGPASFVVTDPDGYPILFDQHR